MYGRREQCTNDYETNCSQRGSEPDSLYLECKASCILSNMERRREGKEKIIIMTSPDVYHGRSNSIKQTLTIKLDFDGCINGGFNFKQMTSAIC